jgi:hypothetical protein
MRATYTFAEHGLLYKIDLAFIFLGLLGLVKNSRFKKFNPVLIIILLAAPVASSLTNIEDSYYFRAFGLMLVFIFLISMGLNYIFTRFEKYRFIFNLILVLYFAFFMKFAYFYFFKYPIIQQENHYLSERIATSYILRNESRTVNIYSENPYKLYQQYMFYSGYLTNNFQITDVPFNVANLYFNNECPVETNDSDVYIFSAELNCQNKGVLKNVIQNQRDSGGIFYIVNDTLCDRNKLNTYRRNSKFKDYAVESLSNPDFCDRLISKI